MTKKKDPADLVTKPITKKAPVEKSGLVNETKATVKVEKSGPKPAPAQARKDGGLRIGLLDSWLDLNKVVSSMSEEESKALIDHEREHECRPAVIMRLHGRFNKLRGKRERQEMMRPVKK